MIQLKILLTIINTIIKPCKVKYIINGQVYYCNFCLNKFCKKKK